MLASSSAASNSLQPSAIAHHIHYLVHYLHLHLQSRPRFRPPRRLSIGNMERCRTSPSRACRADPDEWFPSQDERSFRHSSFWQRHGTLSNAHSIRFRPILWPWLAAYGHRRRVRPKPRREPNLPVNRAECLQSPPMRRSALPPARRMGNLAYTSANLKARGHELNPRTDSVPLLCLPKKRVSNPCIMATLTSTWHAHWHAVHAELFH